MLKHRYKTKEEVPEKYRDLYTEKKDANGEIGFELTEVEGLTTVADVDRLREGLRKERDEHDATKVALKKASDEVGAAADKIKALEKASEGKGPGAKEQQELVLENERLKRENEGLKENGAKTETELTALKAGQTKERIKAALRKAAKGMEGQPGLIRDDAIEDVIEQAADLFVISDNDILTKTGQGDMSGLEPRAYLDKLVKSRAYLVPPSQSGGAGGGDKGSKGKGSGQDDKPSEIADMIPEPGVASK
jgi:hypothetical protein